MILSFTYPLFLQDWNVIIYVQKLDHNLSSACVSSRSTVPVCSFYSHLVCVLFLKKRPQIQYTDYKTPPQIMMHIMLSAHRFYHNHSYRLTLCYSMCHDTTVVTTLIKNTWIEYPD